jgi:hypothetical protein
MINEKAPDQPFLKWSAKISSRRLRSK